MAERRTLSDGVGQTAKRATQEEAFVFGQPRTSVPVASAPSPTGSSPVARVPLTTRLRPELVATLKRASLQRQLGGQHPSAMQDLVEEAIELWLLKNPQN